MLEVQTEWKRSVDNSRRRARGLLDQQDSACDRNQRSRYAEVVLQHLRAGETALAERLLDEAITHGTGCSTKAFYHFLMHKSAEKGCVKSALWFALRMVQRGLHANIVTINSIINACAQAKNLNLAIKWWDLTEKLGVKPNAITYNIMIKACAQARKPTCAEEWLIRMADDGLSPCLISFTTVIDAFAKAGQLAKAEMWLRRMQHFGLRPDRVIYHSLFQACERGGHPNQLREDIFNMIIRSFVEVGDWAAVDYWVREMQHDSCPVAVGKQLQRSEESTSTGGTGSSDDLASSSDANRDRVAHPNSGMFLLSRFEL